MLQVDYRQCGGAIRIETRSPPDKDQQQAAHSTTTTINAKESEECLRGGDIVPESMIAGTIKCLPCSYEFSVTPKSNRSAE